MNTPQHEGCPRPETTDLCMLDGTPNYLWGSARFGTAAKVLSFHLLLPKLADPGPWSLTHPARTGGPTWSSTSTAYRAAQPTCSPPSKDWRFQKHGKRLSHLMLASQRRGRRFAGAGSPQKSHRRKRIPAELLHPKFAAHFIGFGV